MRDILEFLDLFNAASKFEVVILRTSVLIV